MTGFGRASGTLPDGTEASVVVRSVNHRFLDVSLKLRDEWSAAEPALRRLVAASVGRGHVDVLVRTTRPAARSAAFDPETAARYAAAWREAAGGRALPAELTARDLLALPGVVRTDEPAEPDDASREALVGLVEAALADLDRTRAREGEALRSAVAAIVSRLEAGVSRLEEERVGLVERIQAQLSERVRKIVEGIALDEARLAQEVALLAEKADVAEEIDRLRAHLAEIRRLLGTEGPSGKRLDFLAQELHRETNTAGQKSRELPALRAVLDLKADVEALKEQVQNVE